jgi:hypothetical protein
MLFIASLFAAPTGVSVADSVACHSVQSAAGNWAPLRHEVSVRTFGVMQRRSGSTVRVLGRCVVKAGSEHARPVLFGSSALQLDDPDDENLTSRWVEARAPFPRPTAVGTPPTALYVPRAPLTQLERPPRV